MSKKGCELCRNPATMFCESDQASLCWDCDDKVHSANFLVAKHSRTLLCHVCSSPTAWKAAGLKLGPTVSVCHACSEIEYNRATPIERRQDVCENNSQESESDNGEYYSDEEDGENHVVPWAAVTSSVTAGAPTSEDCSLKRMSDSSFESEDEDGCCSSEISYSKLCVESDQTSYQLQSDDNNGSSSSSLYRPLKMRRTSNHGPLVSDEQSQMKSLKGTAAIVDKQRRLQQEFVAEEGEETAMILRICKLVRDT